MTINPYRLPDEQFELFMEAYRLKCGELGLDVGPESFIEVLQDWFYILTDEDTVAGYVDAMNTSADAERKEQLEAELAELNS